MDDTRRPGAAMLRQEALIAELTERVRQLERERDAMRADAERYRWLRDRATVSHVQVATPRGVHYPTTWHFVTGGSDTDMDAAIDAARGAE